MKEPAEPDETKMPEDMVFFGVPADAVERRDDEELPEHADAAAQ